MTDEVHNQSRYIQGKCKCDICRADHSFRSGIYQKANREAAKWVRKYHRQVFEQMLDDQYIAAGVERRPQGRPPGKWSFSHKPRLRLADIDARDVEESA